MTDQWTFQISPKLPDGTLINIRGDNGPDIQSWLTWLSNNAADIKAALAPLGGGSSVGPGPAPAYPLPQSQAPAAPQQEAPAAPQGGKVCQHGAMVYREGTSARGPWKAYFCPTPKGTPGQCAAEFLR